MEKLLKNGSKLPVSINVNLCDKEWKTLLIHAVQSNPLKELIYKLIEDYKADVNIKDKNNKFAVGYAMENKLDFEIVACIAEKMGKDDPILTKVKKYSKLVVTPSSATSAFDYSELDDDTSATSFSPSSMSP